MRELNDLEIRSVAGGAAEKKEGPATRISSIGSSAAAGAGVGAAIGGGRGALIGLAVGTGVGLAKDKERNPWPKGNPRAAGQGGRGFPSPGSGSVKPQKSSGRSSSGGIADVSRGRKK